MSTSAQTPPGVDADAAVDRRRTALTAMLGLAGAAVLVTLADTHVGPAWVHWVGSLVALVAALGVMVIAELNWQRAVTTATAAGLVARSGATARDFDDDGGDSTRIAS